jgi:fatty acid desaturase
MDSKYWYIDGVAYDFSPFARKHPGGMYALMLGKGQECRPLIESYHFPKLPSQALFDQYKLPKEQQPDPSKFKTFEPAQKFTYDKDGFYNTVKNDVRKYFTDRKMSHKAPWSHVVMFVVNVVLMFYFLKVYLQEQSYLFSVLHGIMRAVLVVQTTHSASHFSFSHWPMVNRWCYRVGTMLIGLWSPKTWDFQHVLAHHIYTNEWPYDSDSAFPLKSILYNQRRLWFHKYQHLYMWLVYAFTIPMVMINSIREQWRGRQVTFKMRYYVPGAKIEAWGCSIVSVIYVLMPFFCLPFWTALKLGILSNVVSSLYFSMQFVVNHEVESIIDASPPPKSIDWGSYQVAGSLTFAPDSRFSLEASGGLNTQVEHHLFPGVHYSHYKAISGIVRRVAKDFGLKYQYAPTLFDAVAAHYNLLKHPPKSIREPAAKNSKAKERAVSG